MLESLQWRTDVIRAYSAEQRIRLTNRPRRSFSHSYQLTPRQVEIATRLLRNGAPGPFDLPEWQETSRVDVTGGSGTVLVDTTVASYEVGGKAVIWADSERNQVLTIESLTSDSVTFAAPVSASYTRARIAPVCTAYAPDGMSLSRNVQPIHAAGIEWQTFDGEDLADTAGIPTYRGDLLLTAAARVGSSDLSERLARDVEVIDNGVSRPFFDPIVSAAVQTMGAAWVTTTAADRWALRTLMHALKGRQRAFWLPSQNYGLTLAANASGGATTITVRAVGLNDGNDTGDLIVKRKDGSVVTMRYTSAATSGENEVLTLSAPLASTINISDIHTFCRLQRVRLDADRVEFSHNAPRITKLVVPVIEVPIQ